MSSRFMRQLLSICQKTSQILLVRNESQRRKWLVVDCRKSSSVFLNFLRREEVKDKSLPQRCIPEKIKNPIVLLRNLVWTPETILTRRRRCRLLPEIKRSFSFALFPCSAVVCGTPVSHQPSVALNILDCLYTRLLENDTFPVGIQ